MKKIPYGISDFKSLKEDDYFYIDKTRFIKEIEEMPRYLFFIRPRRFGKSLFLSMLECYYDIRFKDQFQSIFKETYIAKHKTKEANSYYILRFDFSAVNTENVRESLNNYCNKVLEIFIKKYHLGINLTSQHFIDNLNNVLIEFTNLDKKIYLLLDEYDNFINKILIGSQTEYARFITDKEAIYKQFFTVLKSATGGADAPLKKMFITGVSPMALFDVTGGYNIGTNITTSLMFHDAVGITKEELKGMIAYYDLSEAVDIEIMNTWYDNYRFSEEAEHTIYNTDMILYYVNHFLLNKKAPKELIDINVRSDYSKLRFLIYTDKKLNGNFTTLQTLLSENRVSTSKIVDNFSALTLTKNENFKSLMYYLGLLTLEKGGLKQYLILPNETIKRILSDYIKESLEVEKIFELNLETFGNKLANFAESGDLEVFHYLGEVIKTNTQIRDYIDGENFLKGFLLAYFSLSNYFTAISEAELNKGFADIFLNPLNPYVTYVGLLEFKYIKRSTFTQKQLDEKIEEAKTQLAVYEQDSMIEKLKLQGKKVKSVTLIFNGWELVYVG